MEPLLIQYYGNGHAVLLKEPIPTLTTKDRYALVGTDQYGLELVFVCYNLMSLLLLQAFLKIMFSLELKLRSLNKLEMLYRLILQKHYSARY